MAAIAASAISIAPSTDSSASRFCGGTALGVSVRDFFDHDGLDGGDYVVCNLDVDHVGAQFPDRLVQPHLALVQLEPARLADRVCDLLRGDGAEQPAVRAGVVGDREHGLGEQRRRLTATLLLIASGRLGGLHAAPGRGDRRVGGGLCELARREEVPQVTRGDVHDRAGFAEPLDVLQQDRLRHRLSARRRRAGAPARGPASRPSPAGSGVGGRQPVMRRERILPLSDR